MSPASRSWIGGTDEVASYRPLRRHTCIVGIGWGSWPCGFCCLCPETGGWLLMSVLPAQDQQKTWTRDISRGPSPAAAMNQLQDRPVMCRARLFGFVSNNTETCRGDCLGPLNSHRLDSLPSRRRVSPLALLLPVNRGTRQSIRATGFPSDPAQSCTNQGLRKLTSGRVHIRRRLSCLPSSDSSKTIGKALTHDAEPLSSRDKSYD
jgi:hypothetical protein